MAEMSDWEFPSGAQPKPEEVSFDLDAALASVVALHSHIPGDAFTAPLLGTEREGNGVVISNDGLVLTIGYLITEAETIWLTTVDGIAAPAHFVAYDQATGFGMVQALGRLGVPAIERGTSASSDIGDRVIVASAGGRPRALNARVVSKREFAGYWEYVLDEAIFTTPVHPHWGGAALIGVDGTLHGIGSLLVQESEEGGEAVDGNMIVPIDLLDPILDDLLTLGRANRPSRPWLGMYTAEARDSLVVAGVADDGPAQRADVQVGDIVLEVGGEAVEYLADMFRKIWAQGPAGADILMTLERGGDVFSVHVRSANRQDYLKKPRLH